MVPQFHHNTSASGGQPTIRLAQDSNRKMAISTMHYARPDLPYRSALYQTPLPSPSAGRQIIQERKPYLDNSIFDHYADLGRSSSGDAILSATPPSWMTTAASSDKQAREFGQQWQWHTPQPESYGHRGPQPSFSNPTFYRQEHARENSQSLVPNRGRHMTPPSHWSHHMFPRPDLSHSEPSLQPVHKQDQWPEACPTPPYWADDASSTRSTYGGPSPRRASSVYSHSEHGGSHAAVVLTKSRRMASPPDTPPVSAPLPEPESLSASTKPNEMDLTQTFHHIHNYIPEEGTPLAHRESEMSSILERRLPPEVVKKIVMAMDYPSLIAFGRTCYRFQQLRRKVLQEGYPLWKKHAAILAAEGHPKNFPKKSEEAEETGEQEASTLVNGSRQTVTRRQNKAAPETLGNWGCYICFRIFGSDHFEGQSFVEDESAKGKKGKRCAKGTKVDMRIDHARVVGVTEDKVMLVPFRGLTPMYVPTPLMAKNKEPYPFNAFKTVFERSNEGRDGSEKERYAYEIPIPHDAERYTAPQKLPQPQQDSSNVGTTVGRIHQPRDVPYMEQPQIEGAAYKVGDIIPLRRFCIPCGAKYGLYRRDDNVKITSKTGHNWWVCDCRIIWQMGTADSVGHCPACNRAAIFSGRLGPQ